MCETKYLTMSSKQMPKPVRLLNAGQMKADDSAKASPSFGTLKSPPPVAKKKPDKTKGSTSGSKASAVKVTSDNPRRAKNDLSLSHGTKDDSTLTTKETDKRTKYPYIKPDSTTAMASRKLKSPQIMKKSSARATTSVILSDKIVKCPNEDTDRNNAIPTASQTKSDIPNCVMTGNDTLNQTNVKIQNNTTGLFQRVKQTNNKMADTSKLPTKTSKQPDKTYTSSNAKADSKLITPTKRNKMTTYKADTVCINKKVMGSPTVTKRDLMTSSRNSSKSPSPLVLTSGCTNGSTCDHRDVQSKIVINCKATSKASCSKSERLRGIKHAKMENSKELKNYVSNRPRSRSTTPCSVTSSKSESNSSSTTSSDSKKQKSRDVVKKEIEKNCKSAEKKETSVPNTANLDSSRKSLSVMKKSTKTVVANSGTNAVTETEHPQAQLNQLQPYSKTKSIIASSQGTKRYSALENTNKIDSKPIKQTKMSSVPSATELKRAKCCSKTVANSPKSSHKITQAAMTVTDRLSKLPKSKTRANVINKDISSQLMSIAGKQKQIYTFAKQKRKTQNENKNKAFSESSSVSKRESKKACSSIISNNNISTENNKLLIKSNTEGINKRNKPDIKRYNSDSQREKITEEIFSKTKEYTRNAHQNNIFEGDKCMHIQSMIEEQNTCTVCQLQEQNECACNLQSGVKTSHLSGEVSNRNDLGYGLLTEKDVSSEAEIVSDRCLDRQSTMENIEINNVGNGDYSCLSYDSTSILTKEEHLDYHDVCDSNICKHTCNTCDTNDQIYDINDQTISILYTYNSDCTEHLSDCELLNNETKTNSDVTNIRDEIKSSNLMETHQTQVYQFTPCLGQQLNDYENRTKNSLTQDEQDDKFKMSFSCPNEDTESNESNRKDSVCALTRKHKQFTKEIDNHCSLLNKHSPGETISEMIPENQFMHFEAFEIKNNSLQMQKKFILSDASCIGCKYSLDKCTCTSEKSENEVSLSKSDINLARNRHTGIVSYGNLCSNVCTWKSDCKNNYFCKTLNIDGFLPSVGILAHLTSYICNKMQNKLEDGMVCGNNFNITHTGIPFDKTTSCSSNDIACNIKASQQDGSINRNTGDNEIDQNDAGLLKHMSLSDLDEKTPSPDAQDISSGSEHLQGKDLKEDRFNAAEECCSHMFGPDHTQPVSMFDSVLQETWVLKSNSVEPQTRNTCEPRNTESFVSLIRATMDKYNELQLDKKGSTTDQLTSPTSLQCPYSTAGDLIDGCTVRNSLESSVDPKNVEIKESYLAVGNESCTELNLSSPESAMVTECPHICETQENGSQNVCLVTSHIETGATLGNALQTDSERQPPDKRNENEMLNFVTKRHHSINDADFHLNGQVKLQLRRRQSLPNVNYSSSALAHKRRNSSGIIGNTSAGDNAEFNSVPMAASVNFGICMENGISIRILSLKELCSRYIKDSKLLQLDSAESNVLLSSPNWRDANDPHLDIQSDTSPFILNHNSSILEKTPCTIDHFYSENKDQLPVAEQMSNTDSDVCFCSRSETANITRNSCNLEDHFYSIYSSSDITDLPERNDCCSGNCSHVESIEESAGKARNCSVQVLNHENWEIVKAANEKHCSIPCRRVTTSVHEPDNKHLLDTSSCIDLAPTNALSICTSLNDQNKESGYFSNDQSQEDSLTCLNENESHDLQISASNKIAHNDALSVEQDISNTWAANRVYQRNMDVSRSENEKKVDQYNYFVSASVQKTEATHNGITSQENISSFESCQTDLQKEYLLTESCENDDEVSQNLMSYCSSTEFEDLSNRESQNKYITDNFEVCCNCSRLLNKNEGSENSVKSCNEANDKNQISSVDSKTVTSENLSEDSLHHDQAVCGQSNQIKVDKKIENLKETSNFSDKNYGLSCTHGINRCQECFKNSHISEKFNTYGQNIKVEDLHNLSGCLCIEQDYCDHVFDLCSENIIQEEISCSEASLQTSNVCCKSSHCIYDSSKDKTADKTRLDLISPENCESKQEGCVQDVLFSKQNDTEFSQQNYHLRNNAISISNGENCESFYDPIHELPGSYSSVSDGKNVENHLAKRKFTDISDAFSNNHAYSDLDVESRCFDVSRNVHEGKFTNKCNVSCASEGLDAEAFSADESVCEEVNFCQDYAESCCDSSLLQRHDIESFLPEKNGCENKDVCQEYTESSYDDFKCIKCYSESDVLNETGVLINSSEDVDLSNISTYYPGVAPIIKLTKSNSETGVNISVNSQFCSSTCFKEAQTNEKITCHISENNKHVVSKTVDHIIANQVSKSNLITCEGGESLSDYISDEDLYLNETTDTFVDAENGLFESDVDNINDLSNSNPNRCSALYTGSETSTSIDSFKDAIGDFDNDFDYKYDNCDDILDISSCFCYKQAGIYDDCHETTATDRSLHSLESCDVCYWQNIQTENTLSSCTNTESLENSENTCSTDNSYLDLEISSNTDNSPGKFTYKCLYEDSLCESNLKINENKLGYIKQFEDSSLQQDKSSERSANYSSEFTCKHSCTCENMSESKAVREVQSDMSQKDKTLSNDICRDQTRVQVVHNHGNCARSRYEELIKDRNQVTNQSSPKSVRVRHSSRVLNSVNILESKVTAQTQAVSSTADVEGKIETALIIRNEKRRLRQLNNQTSLRSTENDAFDGSSNDTVPKCQTAQNISPNTDEGNSEDCKKNENIDTQSINKITTSLGKNITDDKKIASANSKVSQHYAKQSANDIKHKDSEQNSTNEGTQTKYSSFTTLNARKYDRLYNKTVSSVAKNYESSVSPAQQALKYGEEKTICTREKSPVHSTLNSKTYNALTDPIDNNAKETESESMHCQKMQPFEVTLPARSDTQEPSVINHDYLNNEPKVSNQIYMDDHSAAIITYLVSNDSVISTKTQFPDLDNARNGSKQLPRTSVHNDTRLSLNNDCLVSHETDSTTCSDTTFVSQTQNEMTEKTNSLALFSDLTVTYQMVEDVCQILQGTDIREVSISAQEMAPFTYATASTVITSLDSTHVIDCETVCAKPSDNVCSQTCTRDLSEICSEVSTENIVESVSSLPQSLPENEHLECLEGICHNINGIAIRGVPDTDLSCSNIDTCENQVELSESSNTNRTQVTRTVHSRSQATTETYDCPCSVQIVALSRSRESSATENTDLSSVDVCEHLKTNLENISTSDDLKVSNFISSKTCMSVQNVDSSIHSAKIKQNNDVIYSNSENIPLILSQNHDAVLCIQAHGVCSDKAGESLQLNENSLSNSEYRLSNKPHKELHYDLKLHDINNDSEISKKDDGGLRNFDCIKDSSLNPEESQNVWNFETVSTQSASDVPLQDRTIQNDSKGILCVDGDADLSFEVNIIDYTIDNEISSNDLQILEKKDSLTDKSKCADLSSISSTENVKQENIPLLESRTPTYIDLDCSSKLAIDTVVDTDIDKANNNDNEYTENKGRTEVSEAKSVQQMCRQSSMDKNVLIQTDKYNLDSNQERNDCIINQIGYATETGQVVVFSSLQVTECKVMDTLNSSCNSDVCQSPDKTETISFVELQTKSLTTSEQLNNMRDINFINDLTPVSGNKTDSEVCEDSNISVALALRREREKLTEANLLAPERKPGNRNFRRATTAIILQNRERKLQSQIKDPSDDTKLEVPVKLKKSKSFQESSLLECNAGGNRTGVKNNEKGNETDSNFANKKVSDICKAFIEKTQISIAEKQVHKLSPAVSPLPQRKYKSWICKEGKWKRESMQQVEGDKLGIHNNNSSSIDTQDWVAHVESGQNKFVDEVSEIKTKEGHNRSKVNYSETANSSGFDSDKINVNVVIENISNKGHNEYQRLEDQSKQFLNEQIKESKDPSDLDEDTSANNTRPNTSNESIADIKSESLTVNERDKRDNDKEKKDDILSLIMGEGIEYMDGVEHVPSDTSESWYSTSSTESEETQNLDNKRSNTSIMITNSLNEKSGQRHNVDFKTVSMSTAVTIAAQPVSLVSLCKDALALIDRGNDSTQNLETETCAEIQSGPVSVLPPHTDIRCASDTKYKDIDKRIEDMNETSMCHGINSERGVSTSRDICANVNNKHMDNSTANEKNMNEIIKATDERINEINKIKIKKKPMVPLPSKLPYGNQKHVMKQSVLDEDISVVTLSFPETSMSVDIIEKEQTDDQQLPPSIDSGIPKRIPKLKAVKIKEEEIFEGKPEYTKECNLHPLDFESGGNAVNLNVINDQAKGQTTKMKIPTDTMASIKKSIPTNVTTGKHMVKSKTFSALQDLRNESVMQSQMPKGVMQISKAYNAKEASVQSACKIPKPKSSSKSAAYVNEKSDSRLDQNRNAICSQRYGEPNKKQNDNEIEKVSKLTRTISLPDTRLVYGQIPTKIKPLKPKNDEKLKAVKDKKISKLGLTADGELDRSRGQIPTSTDAGDGDDTKSKRCERSKSLQRPKCIHDDRAVHFSLLSEIAEVEESHEDNISPRNNKGPDTAPRGEPSLEPRVKRPVTRSNKRRSLSLPTGTLAFGEARIVYRNGHFTIETMDGTELDSSELTIQQSCYVSNQEQSSNQKPCNNRPHRTPGKMLPEPHSDLRREIITERPYLRRQVGKTVLTRNELIDKGDEFKSNIENVSPNQKLYNQQNLPLSSLCSKEKIDSSFRSLHSSEQSLNQSSESLSYSEQMELDHENESRGNKPVRYHSSSSLLDTDKEEVKRVAQRARRTSSFRQAQEQGSYRLSGIQEDKDHIISKRQTVSLDESQHSDLNQSRISQNPNQSTNFFQRMMAKRKSSMENFNLSSFAKQSESAKDFFSKKMTLKGLFRKHRSDSPANSPLRTQFSSSPPVSVFSNDEDRDSFGSTPNSPFRSKDMRRRHTSADLFSKAFKDATSSSHPNSNCSTPTRDQDAFFRSNSTPGIEANFIVRTDTLAPSRTPSSILKSTTPTPDEDQLSIKSTSSATSSVHSVQTQQLEQPHKPKTPKPVGTSPRRIPSGSSQSSQSSRIFLFKDRDRGRTLSATSLESENSEIVFEDYSDLKCECENLTPSLTRSRKSPNTSSSSVFPIKCELCGKYTAEFLRDPQRLKKFTIGPDSSEDHERLKKDWTGRLALLVQSEISASNSNDSGIQHDVSVHSSSESLKGTPESKVRLRRQKSSSPRPERPKSEIGVRWADLDTQEYDITTTPVRRRDRSQNIKDRPRPKSDFEDNIQLFDELFLEVLEDFETDGSSFFSDRMKAFGSEINLQPYCSLRNLYEMRRRDWESTQGKNRRMSTPHPIKSRLQRTPKRLQKQAPLVRSSSMPESLDKVHKRRKLHHLLDFHEASLSKHMDLDECLSDDSDLSFDHISLQEKSLSIQSSQSQLTSMDEEEDNLTYAEALWDHITMDPEELGFRAGDLINVFDMSDKDWWFGEIEDREGWFPAAFVRLRVNQDQFEDELEVTLQPELSTSPKLRRISMINKDQARTNVVNEIISAEREYVKHLKDVVEGYIQHARKRHEMFPEERLSLIFGNIESIYAFAQKFLSQLEMCIDVCPHLSEIGQCFLDNEKGFEIYSDYCNNHPSACEELKDLYTNAKYRHFFEACRLLQELVEIPLEGFLLTPVQKICKYPLQLAELLKYTPPEHADYLKVKAALYEMRKIATLINERKRKMESIEKIAAWQHTVADWEGEDLLAKSSELIFSGDINKINSAGWSQERYFFLFDHQLIYCKKELLKRHVFSYKGRIDLDHCDIIPLPDGKDTQYNVTVKHAWKLHEIHRDKWYLLYTKTDTVKDRWLKALADERKRVREDQENDFCVPEHWKQTVLNKVRSQSSLKEKHHSHRPTPDSHIMLQKDFSSSVPYATLPRVRRSTSQKQEKKKGWFNFGGKKSKR